MGMRIWHQSLAVFDHQKGYGKGLEARLPKLVRPDTEVVIHGFLPGSYSGNYPGQDVGHAYLQWIHGNQWIAAAQEAERQGFDAMVLSNLPNPMLREIRTLVDIPVLGMGDTVFRTCGLYGRRFGLLFFNTVREDFWPEQIRMMGLSESFVGAVPAGATFHEVAETWTDEKKRAKVVDQIVAVGERMVKELGADVIVPGEGPMNVLLGNAGISSIAGATVMDSMAITFKMAEVMIELHRSSGMLQSRHGWFHSQPAKGRVEEVQKFYGVDFLAKRIAEEG